MRFFFFFFFIKFNEDDFWKNELLETEFFRTEFFERIFRILRKLGSSKVQITV